MQATRLIVMVVAALAVVVCAWANIALAEGVKTSKERLTDKAADNQRVDNCRVPVERRGPIARPGCAGEIVSDAPTAEERAKATAGSR